MLLTPSLLIQSITVMVRSKAKARIFPLMTAALLISGVNVAAYQDDKATPKKDYAHEYYQSFKGKPDNMEALALQGPDAQERVKYESSGLRITLPRGYPDQRPGTGLALVSTVNGDFEITMSFEILKEPDPADAGKKYGTRVSLGVWLDTPDKNECSLSRRIDSRGTMQFVTYLFMAKVAAGDTPKPRYLPTAARVGRLRLARSGSVLSLYASEGINGDFVFLKEYPYSDLPLKKVYVTASTGGAQAELDVRVSEFRIRADAFPSLPKAALIAPLAPVPVSVPGEEATPTKSRTTLLMALIGGVLLTVFLAIAGGAWLYMRRRQAVATSDPSSFKVDQTIAAAPVVFQCSACRKTLKARPELAGKKTKCSACGKVVIVPDVSVDEP